MSLSKDGLHPPDSLNVHRPRRVLLMKLIDSICAPGSSLGGGLKDGSGDDRYAFDELAGWACVIDGATDVGRVRLFPRAESDASHYAELFADVLVSAAPKPGESVQAYFTK